MRNCVRARMPVVMLAVMMAMFAAGPAAAAPATITVVQARAAIDEIAKLVARDYVFPEKRAAIVAELRKREAAGRYDITNAAQFAQTVSEDMVAISHDRHMWFEYDPAEYAALRQPKGSEQSDAYFRAGAARDNQGYAQLRILPGNIRYVELTGFEWVGDTTTNVIADVARFLHGADAIIFDISSNGGGDPAAVKAIVSYFLPPDGRTLMLFHDGLSGKTTASKALVKLAGPRLTGIPLYVLISGNTGSAAEGFAYQVKNFKLGTLVGTKTIGAANNDDVFPVAPFFAQSISVGRPEHPVTHTNWEGTGIAPDVAAPRDRALIEAQILALKNLIASGPSAHRPEYEWALIGAKAKLDPVALAAAALPAYAGQYGSREIRVVDGALQYARPGREPLTMVPLSQELFAFKALDGQRIRFHRSGGRITGFDLITQDGQAVSFTRSS